MPHYEYKSERNELRDWCIDGDRDGRLEAYMQKNNTPPDLQEYTKKKVLENKDKL
ncbi:MAG: hypothetical protein HY307_05010 [Arcobacter sp.]|nr:hypothetical protein [Arcobacter sp.]